MTDDNSRSQVTGMKQRIIERLELLQWYEEGKDDTTNALIKELGDFVVVPAGSDSAGQIAAAKDELIQELRRGLIYARRLLIDLKFNSVITEYFRHPGKRQLAKAHELDKYGHYTFEGEDPTGEIALLVIDEALRAHNNSKQA